MLQYRSRMTAVVLAIALTCVAWGQEPASAPGNLRPSFKDADLAQIAQVVGQATGRTVVLGSGVCARVSAIWENEITPDEFYQAFVSIAVTLEFMVIEQGSVTTITLDDNASQDSQTSCRRYPQTSHG